MPIITASMFMALDGVVDPTIGHWHFPYFNDEMAQAVTGTHDADVMLFGRVTYDSFAGAWPGREVAGGEDAGFAKRLGDVRKIVASHQRMDFTWRNSEQLDGDLVEGVAALKKDPCTSAGSRLAGRFPLCASCWPPASWMSYTFSSTRCWPARDCVCLRTVTRSCRFACCHRRPLPPASCTWSMGPTRTRLREATSKPRQTCQSTDPRLWAGQGVFPRFDRSAHGAAMGARGRRARGPARQPRNRPRPSIL